MLPLEVMAVLLSVLACVRVRVCASELALERACPPSIAMKTHELLLPEGAPSPYPGDAYLPGARKLPAT